MVVEMPSFGIGLCTLQAVRTIWPFYFAAFVVLVIVTYVPAASLWLPHLFR